jgi:hypothetical protein
VSRRRGARLRSTVRVAIGHARREPRGCWVLVPSSGAHREIHTERSPPRRWRSCRVLCAALAGGSSDDEEARAPPSSSVLPESRAAAATPTTACSMGGTDRGESSGGSGSGDAPQKVLLAVEDVA